MLDVKLLAKLAAGVLDNKGILAQLLAAKKHSDAGRYELKNRILKELMQQAPDEWIIDDPKPKYKGVTHIPTKFKLHADPRIIDAAIKEKTASWLTEGFRSFFKPQQPALTANKDMPRAPVNAGMNKSMEMPFWQQNKSLQQNKGFAKSTPQTNYQQPQYNYFNPPGHSVKITVTPYDYLKPLYSQYGNSGFQQAIDDTQRWQEHARLEGLSGVTPETLKRPVIIRTGGYILPYEQRRNTTGVHKWFGYEDYPVGFYSANNKYKGTGAYQITPEINEPGSANFSRNAQIIMNPRYTSNFEENKDWLRSTYGHELTHAYNTNTEGENVFKGKEQLFNKDLNPPAFGGKQSTLDYKGTPTEFAAYLSEIRRHYMEKNPTARINNLQAAEKILQQYTPVSNEEYVKNYKDYLNKFTAEQKSNIDFNQNLKSLPADSNNSGSQARYMYLPQQYPTSKMNKDPGDWLRLYEQHVETEPTSFNEFLKKQPIIPDVSSIQDLLPVIMKDPDLKRKAILQILSIVKNNQKQDQSGIQELARNSALKTAAIEKQAFLKTMYQIGQGVLNAPAFIKNTFNPGVGALKGALNTTARVGHGTLPKYLENTVDNVRNSTPGPLRFYNYVSPTQPRLIDRYRHYHDELLRISPTYNEIFKRPITNKVYSAQNLPSTRNYWESKLPVKNLENQIQDEIEKYIAKIKASGYFNIRNNAIVLPTYVPRPSKNLVNHPMYRRWLDQNETLRHELGHAYQFNPNVIPNSLQGLIYKLNQAPNNSYSKAIGAYLAEMQSKASEKRGPFNQIFSAYKFMVNKNALNHYVNHFGQHYSKYPNVHRTGYLAARGLPYAFATGASLPIVSRYVQNPISFNGAPRTQQELPVNWEDRTRRLGGARGY